MKHFVPEKRIKMKQFFKKSVLQTVWLSPIILATYIVLFFSLFGCNAQQKIDTVNRVDSVMEYQEYLEYFQDSYGNCYAVIKSMSSSGGNKVTSFTTVPCSNTPLNRVGND